MRIRADFPLANVDECGLCCVLQVVREHGLLASVLPKHLSIHAAEGVKTFGVDVHTEVDVESVNRDADTGKVE